MAKKGRKPKGESKKEYFGEREERAVIEYNLAETASEKDQIYNSILKPAFIKMIESIIRRYKLYGPDEEFEETFNDTLSYLVTRLDYFHPERGAKAYSFCGTVAKNYLIQKIHQHQKKLMRNTPYEEMNETLDNDIRYSDREDSFASTAHELIGLMSNEVKQVLKNAQEGSLTTNETKVGNALCLLLDNWEEILDESGSNKLNKSSVLYFLREETRLDTPEIREGMKKFKIIYQITKKGLLS